MKLSLPIVMLMLGMTACAKSTPPPKPVEAPIHNASVEDCNHVYERVLSITLVQVLDSDQLFSKEAVQKAGEDLDRLYTQSGKKQLLFQVCTRHFNVEQTKCMAEANTLEDMDLCLEVFQTKKNQ